MRSAMLNPPPSLGGAHRRHPATLPGVLDRFDGLPTRRLAGGLVVVQAATRRAKARGLAGMAALPDDHALLIPRCRSVHTFHMRFALDLVWLDAAGRPVRVDAAVPPRRLRTCLRARSVLECGAGRAVAFLGAGL
jgi:uncharacterized membrane protein (UPF0127 family)